MKKYLILILIEFLYLNGKTQIVLEHTYDSSSTIQSNMNQKLSQLMIVKFEVSGERYVRINGLGKTISIYAMDHSLIKTIDCKNFPVGTNTAYMDILYLSENLFDNDSSVEFMWVIKTNNSGWDSYFTGIYNEDGSLIFSDTAAPIIKNNTPLQQYPIYNTTRGTKMILSYTNGLAKVFSLPGTLSTAIQEANGQLMQQSEAFNNLYPNPNSGEVTLEYLLPAGVQQGELVLYNMQGAEIKHYKVDNTFNNVIINNSELPAGTYFYQLQTCKGTVGTKKMVVVK